MEIDVKCPKCDHEFKEEVDLGEYADELRPQYEDLD